MKKLGSQEEANKVHATAGGFPEEGRLFSLCACVRGEMSAHQWWGANICSEEAGELRSVAMKVKCQASVIWLDLCKSCQYTGQAMVSKGTFDGYRC